MIVLIALWFVTCGDPIINQHQCPKYIVLERLSSTPESLSACYDMAEGYRKNGHMQQAMGAPVSYQCRVLDYPNLTRGE